MEIASVVETRQVDGKHAHLMEAYITKAVRNGCDLIGVEIPWSHYGNRGVLDAALWSSKGKVGGRVLVLAEFKSELIDVGGCIRQVELVRKYFLKGAQMPEFEDLGESCEVRYPVILLATMVNARQAVKYHHLLRDMELYFFHEDDKVRQDIMNKYEIMLAIQRVKDTPMGDIPVVPVPADMIA